ncbi:class I SAM-dependent methyltransferase [candidate division KSB1 bacterium]|nr:class I SAM-dependent methyltransferase [candidate division KSB1 bacterium]
MMGTQKNQNIMPQYTDYAEYYDQDHGGDSDIAFYLDYAKKCGSPILELACGTGRVLLPLANAGFEVHGIDLSENMLNVCRLKMKQQNLFDKIHLYRANMSNFEMERKDFTLVYIAVRSFMHIFNQKDQLACLAQVYRHLRPGGYFIVNVYAPNLRKLLQEPDAAFVVTSEYELDNGNHIIRSDRFVRNDPLLQIQYSERKFEEYDRTGRLVRQRVVPLDTRYTFRYELQLLLEKVGFHVIDIFRDYAKHPFDSTGEIIMVAVKK